MKKTDKKKLRENIQKARDGLSPEKRQEKSREIANIFFKSSYYRKAGVILAYHPFRSEIDTTAVIRKALTDRKKVILPRVEHKRLKLYYVQDPKSQLEPGTYGIMEPVRDKSVPAGSAEVDLALVPGVAFDRNMNRLGYGGGFYDRLLPRLDPGVKKVALCFNLQLVPEVPALEHDIKIDVIITELEEIIGQRK
ncbi:MAG: 5-formyltetrahydrofolate cyclo-ligase [Actinomycetota bacterium]